MLLKHSLLENLLKLYLDLLRQLLPHVLTDWRAILIKVALTIEFTIVL